MRRRPVLTYPMVLCCCFFCGLAAGTVFVNCLEGALTAPDGLAQYAAGYGMARTAGRFSLWGYAELTAKQSRRLWMLTVRQRLSELALMVLVGQTPLAAGGFAALAFLAGCVFGLTLSVLTVARGVWGLPVFLVSLLPQWLCYVPVWLSLAEHAGEGQSVLRPRHWVFSAMLVAVGTFLEAYVNPFLLRF